MSTIPNRSFARLKDVIRNADKVVEQVEIQGGGHAEVGDVELQSSARQTLTNGTNESSECSTWTWFDCLFSTPFNVRVRGGVINLVKSWARKLGLLNRWALGVPC